MRSILELPTRYVHGTSLSETPLEAWKLSIADAAWTQARCPTGAGDGRFDLSLPSYPWHPLAISQIAMDGHGQFYG